jgi:hypothetical protein
MPQGHIANHAAKMQDAARITKAEIILTWSIGEEMNR